MVLSAELGPERDHAISGDHEWSRRVAYVSRTFWGSDKVRVTPMKRESVLQPRLQISMLSL